ncbi:hypothetical protein OPQ81_009021 [Rhizoctonia solani]|nr:hypothetical protein OPQ81_009021 [Rhizoctonia solani]
MGQAVSERNTMSGILWSRRPSASDTTAVNIPPRPRTTSGGGLAVISSALGLNKAKSRERLRANGTTSLPAKTSPNRQTVVSTESGSSDVWNEPTTPSSASDTKRSFQGINGVGIGGDDPFARPPVYVSKEKEPQPQSPLAAFPDPPTRRPRTATPRNHSTPLLDPGPSRHLHPPSPSSSRRSPKSSRTSSPSRSRSTSASSSVNPAKSPRTPPPMISSVSPADMHAHADAVSWSPESIYEQVDIRPRQYDDIHSRSAQEITRPEDASIRRGQSAHAVLSPSSSSSRAPSTPKLAHSASSSHLSSPPTSPLLSPPHAGRAGLPVTSGMGSMTAMMMGLGDEPGPQAKVPPKRPSKSELRLKNKASTSSLSNYIPPKRKASLLALQESWPAGLEKVPEGALGSVPQAPPESAKVLEPPPPRSPESILQALGPLELQLAPTPPRPRTASTPSLASPRPLAARLAGHASPRLAPTSPRLNPSSPRLGPISPRLNPSSPRSPRLATSPTFPTFSDDAEDLDNYHFTIAPAIHEADAQSISFSELGVQLGDDESWEDDGATFHHGATDSLHYVSPDSSRYGTGSRRPPPSPTSLPFMAGNVRRKPRQDTVYPSGVHTIPISDQYALAKIGKEEDLKEEDAVVGQTQIELEQQEEEFPTPPASSPSLVNPLDRMSTGSQTSSCSSIAPDAVPPQTVSSHVAFSKHTRTASYSDSEVDFELTARAGISKRPAQSTQTAVAWRCGAGNHEKCCGTRAMQQGPNSTGRYKCCAERTPSGKNARCCASFIGRPCERPRVSSTSSAELKRQRSLHFSPFPSAPVSGGKRTKGFFHRPHTSHGKSTSSALLDDETKAIIQSKTREDPGPLSPSSDVFTVVSPPTSPVSRQEFKAKPIISPAKLYDHLKETRASVSPAPIADPLKSPKLEPTRARSNTTTTDSGSVLSDAPAPLRSLPPRPRRNQNVSLPIMTTSQPVQQPRRYVHSITSVVQPAGLTRPPPRSPASSGIGLPSLSSGSSSIASVSGISSISASGISSMTSSSGFAPIAPGSGLPPPPPRRLATGRVNTQPIVSFISSRSAPTPHSATEPTAGASAAALRHRSSRESYESSRTVRRERSIPLRENQMSFLEFGVEEEEESEEEEELEPQPQPRPSRPTLQHTQSFLDLSSRQSGDTMRESMAMYS